MEAEDSGVTPPPQPSLVPDHGLRLPEEGHAWPFCWGSVSGLVVVYRESPRLGAGPGCCPPRPQLQWSTMEPEWSPSRWP